MYEMIVINQKLDIFIGPFKSKEDAEKLLARARGGDHPDGWASYTLIPPTMQDHPKLAGFVPTADPTQFSRGR